MLRTRARDLRTGAFWIVWVCQCISVLGSGTASFVLGLSVYQETHDAYYLGWITGASTFLSIFGAPMGGSLVDKFGSRKVVLGSTLGAAMASLFLALIAGNCARYIVLVIMLSGLSGLFNGIISLSLVASVRAMRSEGDLTRLNGIISLVDAAPSVAAPILGAAVFAVVPRAAIFLFDAVTFLISFAGVAVSGWNDGIRGSGSPFWSGCKEGVLFILRRRGFRTLQVAFTVLNICNGLAAASLLAYMLAAGARGSSAAPAGVAVAQSCGAVGLLVGGLLIGAMRVRQRRLLLICAALLLAAIGGRILLVATLLVPVWCLAMLARNVGLQMANAPLTAVWQENVPVEIQGRVFGARKLLGQGGYPLAIILGGSVAHWLTKLWGELPGYQISIGLPGLVEAFAAIGLLSSGSVRRIVDNSSEGGCQAQPGPPS